jgi:short-subunit dehydrogenase
MMMKAIADQLIMITGATDGLGKAVAFELAKMGATLVLHGRNPQKGVQVLKEIREASGNLEHQYYNADFASLKEVRELAGLVLSNHRSLDGDRGR